jgi:hypothetical protein
VAGDEHPGRQPEDPQIERQAAVLGVPEVELDALRPRQRRAAVDLRPPGDAGLQRQAAPLAVGVLGDLHGDGRPRADDGHLAAQDVDEVGQLVDRRPPQQRPDARDAAVAVVDGQAGAHLLGARDHRAELQDVERPAALADAALAVDRVARRLQPDRHHRHRDDRRGERQDGPRDRDVEDAAKRLAHRVPSGGSHPAAVPWRRWSTRPRAIDPWVST